MKLLDADLSIRPHMVKDARGFFEILTGGDFKYFPVNVASVEAEKRFLRDSVESWRKHTAYNFSILLDKEVIGSVGVIPEDSRPYNAEIGYFIAREHHGKGYALRALKLAEKYVLEHLEKIRRLHALIIVGNRPSVRVVEKAGYAEEGILKKYLKCGDSYHDAFIFSRIIR